MTTMTRNNLVALHLNPHGESGLSGYIQTVNALPVLSPEEERALLERYREHDDLEAARRLVLSHLRYVVQVTRQFAGYGLSQADLIQEGNIGLMKAVKSFDLRHKVRLVTFAVHWIRAEIYDFVLRNWRIVKIATTKAQRKLFFNLRKKRRALGWLNAEEAHALAEELNVSVKEVREMETRLSGGDVSFDVNPSDDDDAHTSFAPAAYLEDQRHNPERLVLERSNEDDRHARLTAALQQLDARSQDIVRRRWLHEEKATLSELAKEYNISAERVRQLERNAFAAIKDQLS